MDKTPHLLDDAHLFAKSRNQPSPARRAPYGMHMIKGDLTSALTPPTECVPDPEAPECCAWQVASCLDEVGTRLGLLHMACYAFSSKLPKSTSLLRS